MAIVIHPVIFILVTIMSIKKYRKMLGRQEGGTQSPQVPPLWNLLTLNLTLTVGSLCPSVSCRPTCQPSLFQPGKEAPRFRGTAWSGGCTPCTRCRALHSITTCPHPAIHFPPVWISGSVCASWKHSRHKALLNHGFPRAGIYYLLNKRCPS